MSPFDGRSVSSTNLISDITDNYLSVSRLTRVSPCWKNFCRGFQTVIFCDLVLDKPKNTENSRVSTSAHDSDQFPILHNLELIHPLAVYLSFRSRV